MLTTSFIADFWILAILALIGGHMLFLRKRRRFFLFDPLNTFWGGVFAVYIVQPVSFSATFTEWRAPGTLEWTLFWSFVTFLAVVLGYESKLGVRVANKLPNAPQPDPKKLGVMLFVGLGLGLSGYVILIIAAGGLHAFGEAGRGAAQYLDRLPVLIGRLYQFKFLLWVIVPLFVFYVYFYNKGLGWKIFAWSAAALLAYFTIFLGSRSRIVMLTVALLAAYYIPRRHNPPLKLVIPIGLILFMVVPFLAAFRSNFSNFSLNLDRIDWRAARQVVMPDILQSREAVTGPTYLSRGIDFHCVMAAVELVPEEVGFNYGYAQLQLVTHWWPRPWWPDGRKWYPHYEAYTPIYDKADLSEKWEYHGRKPILSGPSFTFVGHWWGVGGPLTIIIAGFFIGALFRMCRHIYDRDPLNAGNVLLLMLFIPIGFREAAATSLFWITLHWPVFLGVFLVLWLSKRPRYYPHHAPTRYASHGVPAWNNPPRTGL